jgi:hypothetical protein
MERDRTRLTSMIEDVLVELERHDAGASDARSDLTLSETP